MPVHSEGILEVGSWLLLQSSLELDLQILWRIDTQNPAVTW
jgi:hypothetical protein